MNHNRLQVGIDFSLKRADFCLLSKDEFKISLPVPLQGVKDICSNSQYGVTLQLDFHWLYRRDKSLPYFMEAG